MLRLLQTIPYQNEMQVILISVDCTLYRDREIRSKGQSMYRVTNEHNSLSF